MKLRMIYTLMLSTVSIFIAGWSGTGCEEVIESEDRYEYGPQGVWNGQPASASKWPGVFRSRGDGTACSCALIAPQTILSAGHCHRNASGPTVIYFQDGNGQTMANATQWAPHPGFTGNPNNTSEVDLRMFKTDRALTQVDSYCVDDVAAVNGQAIWIVGYGEPSVGTLQEGEGEVLSTNPSPWVGRIEVGGNAGICSGDSGGPSFTEKGGVMAQIGVHSIGVQPGGCGPSGSMDVKVSQFIDWISATTATFGDQATLCSGAGTDSDVDGDSDADSDVDNDVDSDADGDSDNDSDSDGDDDDDDNDNNNDDDNDDNDDNDDSGNGMRTETGCACRTTGASYSSLDLVAALASALF